MFVYLQSTEAEVASWSCLNDVNVLQQPSNHFQNDLFYSPRHLTQKNTACLILISKADDKNVLIIISLSGACVVPVGVHYLSRASLLAFNHAGIN